MIIKFIPSCVLGFLLLILPLTAGSALAQTKLRFGTVFSPTTSTYLLLVDACRKVEQETAGAVAIDIQPAGGFGKPTELLPKVDKGELEIAYTVQGYTPDRFAASSVMELPLIRKTATGGTSALWELYEKGLLARDYQGLKILGLWTLPPYGIFTNDRKVTTIRDLRGLRIRAPGITVARALNKMGVVPVNLPLNKMGTGLKDDLIDGISYGWYSTTTTAGAEKGQTLMDQVNYLVDINFTGPVVMVAMQQTVFDALPEAIRTALDRHMGRALSLAIAEERDQAEDNTRKKIAAGGRHTLVRFTAAETDALLNDLSEVFDEWVVGLKAKGIDGAALLTAARRAVAAHEK